MFTPMRKLAALFRLLALFLPLAVALGNPASTRNQSGKLYLPTNRVYEEVQNNGAETNDSYDVFYDRLPSDGHWLYAENYGYVFQPSIAASNGDWRPYTNGHWESTDRGWYWDTDEPFGWATYHYGRWANIESAGWVWIPGTEWSPAWVSWRVCDDGYIGWAPLSPECPRPTDAVAIGAWCDSYSDTGPGAFSFLPISAWFNPNYATFLAPLSQNLELMNASHNVTNLSASKTVISDFGPHPELITQSTGQQIKTYTIHYSEVPGRTSFGTNISGNTINIDGPAAKLRANATKVPTVVKTLVRPTANKGWNGITKEEMDGLHNKYAAEAHIPRNLPSKSSEGVSLVPGQRPEGIKLVRDQKEKEVKESKQTAKGAEEKGAKGKAASEHKDSGKTGKGKKGSGAKGEGGSKGKHRSKDESDAKGSKSASASKGGGGHKGSGGSNADEGSKVEKTKGEGSKSSSKSSSGTKKKKSDDD
jgi:hypothetical protein